MNNTRLARPATLLIWLMWAWLVMTVTHETGHVIAGMAGGAKLLTLELRPWHLPHSLFAGDAHPLMTLWAGPVLGCLVPLAVAAAARRPACWFIAWFCLVANAAYLLLGYFSGDGELDSAKLIRAGARPIELLGFVAVALPVGYYRFRQACVDLFSGNTPPMTPRVMRIAVAALLVVLILQAVIGTSISQSL